MDRRADCPSHRIVVRSRVHGTGGSAAALYRPMLQEGTWPASTLQIREPGDRTSDGRYALRVALDRKGLGHLGLHRRSVDLLAHDDRASHYAKTNGILLLFTRLSAISLAVYAKMES